MYCCEIYPQVSLLVGCFCKSLPTNNHKQCQLYRKMKIKECVLKGYIPDIEHCGTENKNNKRLKKWENKTLFSNTSLADVFFSLEKYEIPELLNFFLLLPYKY